ncbi:glycine cleavage system aminomethyltransferase GcvT [Egicoccus halophilus]|uniref:Aminomethyltransferase n=1 Tax=Egicoccus halophilus TaxID=1670830 RepID=A0A8J3AB87_9ACTN|nr:glycine cleavage system aminomethyltransferase GcvT [Egicoccus halophilus]GGI07189.1 aminomethyltransferase [Egicoccus halophilus]
MTDLRPTPLTPLHEAAGARLAPFAGWSMPMRFAGTVAEHEAVRVDVGVFDVSHLGTVFVTGSGARDVVAASFTNDPARLGDGDSQYTLCCDERGGIVDDLIVYRLAADRWLAVPNAANTAAVADRLRSRAGEDVEVLDQSADWAILAVQGPRSLSVLHEALTALGGDLDPAAVPHLGIVRTPVGDAEAYVCRTGYTGEVGAELVVPAVSAVGLWQALLVAGATPCGLGARDTLRLEMGYPLHGNDLSTEVLPGEARLGWAVELDRDDFVGRDALVAAREAGPARRLWGLRGTGRRPPRAGMSVLDGDREVGRVTSGSFSPTAGIGVGLALLDASMAPGDRVEVDVRGTPVPFEVVRPPFVERDPKG